MKSIIRRIALIAGVALVAFLVTQCGVLPKEAPVEPVEVAEPVELTYVTGMVYEGASGNV